MFRHRHIIHLRPKVSALVQVIRSQGLEDQIVDNKEHQQGHWAKLTVDPELSKAIVRQHDVGADG